MFLTRKNGVKTADFGPSKWFNENTRCTQLVEPWFSNNTRCTQLVEPFLSTQKRTGICAWCVLSLNRSSAIIHGVHSSLNHFWTDNPPIFEKPLQVFEIVGEKNQWFRNFTRRVLFLNYLSAWFQKEKCQMVQKFAYSGDFGAGSKSYPYKIFSSPNVEKFLNVFDTACIAQHLKPLFSLTLFQKNPHFLRFRSDTHRAQLVEPLDFFLRLFNNLQAGQKLTKKHAQIHAVHISLNHWPQI